MKHTANCFASFMGEWAIEPKFLRRATSVLLAGMARGDDTKISQQRAPDNLPKSATAVIDTNGEDVMYFVTEAGTAVIQMTGVMMKARSKYGGVSTVDARRYIRAAVVDENVGAILLAIDSPGGTVAGTQALADEVRAADAVKPVLAHLEDLGASAGYWVPSQARKISANRSGMVGSLGTYGVVEDSSGQAKAEGVVVHVLSTGAHKGAFVEGAPVTEAQIADYQRIIDGLNAIFMQAVSSGRKLSPDLTAKLFDGRVHLATDAKALGLIDAVQSFDQALAEADALARPVATSTANQRRMEIAKARSR